MLPFPYSIQQINDAPLTNPPVPLTDLTNINGQIQSARVINPVTMDYELNANGTFTGQTVAQTSVYLALFTVFNTSAVSGQGNQVLQGIKVITPNINKQVFSYTQQALSSLINQGLITLLSCTTTNLGNGQINVAVDWQDLTQAPTGQQPFTTNLLLPVG